MQRHQNKTAKQLLTFLQHQVDADLSTQWRCDDVDVEKATPELRGGLGQWFAGGDPWKSLFPVMKERKKERMKAIWVRHTGKIECESEV